LTRWYGRRLSSSLDYRPATAVLVVGIFLALGFMFVNTQAELAPEEDQGILFGITKAPQNANLDYADVFGAELDRVFASYPETDTRFVVNGEMSFAGMILKPWDERTRSAKDLQPLVQQQLNVIEGVQIFVFSPPALPGST